MKIIGLRGPSGVGKDHIFDTILAPSLGAVRWGFSFPIKAEVAADLVAQRGLTPAEAVDLTFVSKPAEIRSLLQDGRPARDREAFGPGVHRRLCAAYLGILSARPEAAAIAIADVRMPEDVAMVRGMNGVVLDIRAPVRLQRSGLADGAVKAHFTEQATAAVVEGTIPINNDPNPPVSLETQVLTAVTQGLGAEFVEVGRPRTAIAPITAREHRIAWEQAMTHAELATPGVIAARARAAAAPECAGSAEHHMQVLSEMRHGDPAALAACWDIALRTIWGGTIARDATPPRAVRR